MRGGCCGPTPPAPGPWGWGAARTHSSAGGWARGRGCTDRGWRPRLRRPWRPPSPSGRSPCRPCSRSPSCGGGERRGRHPLSGPSSVDLPLSYWATRTGGSPSTPAPTHICPSSPLLCLMRVRPHHHHLPGPPPSPGPPEALHTCPIPSVLQPRGPSPHAFLRHRARSCHRTLVGWFLPICLELPDRSQVQCHLLKEALPDLLPQTGLRKWCFLHPLATGLGHKVLCL